MQQLEYIVDVTCLWMDVKPQPYTAAAKALQKGSIYGLANSEFTCPAVGQTLHTTNQPTNSTKPCKVGFYF